MEARSIYLFLTQDSSDKAYNVHLRQQGDGWVVDFENGRRGKTLRSGTKTADPIGYDDALALYEKTVRSKTSKGYTEDESGTAFAGTDKEGEVTGFRPPLLNDVTLDDLHAHARTGEWLLGRKHDGERRGITLRDGEIIFSNKKGLRVGVNQALQSAVEALAASGVTSFEIDGEDMGSTHIAFDIYELNREDFRDLPFEKRVDKLDAFQEVLATAGEDVMATMLVDKPEPTPTGEALTREIARRRDALHEGIVLRHKSGKAVAGRPTSGGQNLKYKFWESCTVRVADRTATKRSVKLELRDGEKWIAVGNCTIPPSHEVPNKGDYAEIRYLYAYKGGSLYQPAYLGVRTDVDDSDAHYGQLKFVAEPA